MTTELTVLALAGLLQALQLVLMAVPVNLEVGTSKTASPRDRCLIDAGQNLVQVRFVAHHAGGYVRHDLKATFGETLGYVQRFIDTLRW